MGSPGKQPGWTHGKFFSKLLVFFSFLVRRSPAVPLRKVPRSCFNIPLQVWWFWWFGDDWDDGDVVDGGWGKADVYMFGGV